MGLKQNIKNAFTTSLTYKVDNKDVNPIANDETGKAEKKIDQLAEDLSIAIRDFIVAQTFSITDLEATIQFPPGAIKTVGSPGAQANVIPILGNAVVKEIGVPSNQSPQASLKSKTSKVVLKKQNVMELV